MKGVVGLEKGVGVGWGATNHFRPSLSLIPKDRARHPPKKTGKKVRCKRVWLRREGRIRLGATNHFGARLSLIV